MKKTGETGSITTHRFTFSELGISRSELESLMGYVPGAMPEPLRPVIDETLSLAGDRCAIQGGFVIREDPVFKRDARLMSIGSVTFNLPGTIFRQVMRAGSIALFVCTAGPGISDWAGSLMAGGDPTAGYIADLLGSAIVERAMDRMHALLADRMTAEGSGVSNRYSPGYCGWDVSEQRALFSLLPDGFCGVRLSGSAMMRPLKSVSGIIAIGKDIRFSEYGCGACDRVDCPYRGRKTGGGAC
ncbi:MAG: methionine synthase [Spirochaetes bacterium]|nr:methionine synthase [Spirochaetota bacterium]